MENNRNINLTPKKCIYCHKDFLNLNSKIDICSYACQNDVILSLELKRVLLIIKNLDSANV